MGEHEDLANTQPVPNTSSRAARIAAEQAGSIWPGGAQTSYVVMHKEAPSCGPLPAAVKEGRQDCCHATQVDLQLNLNVETQTNLHQTASVLPAVEQVGRRQALRDCLTV